MYIGKANIDLINHKVFEKEYSIKKDKRFIARDGVLYNEYRAELITILKNVKSRTDEDVDGYLELENASNKHFIDVELRLKPAFSDGEDLASYESLKLENEKLKSELENSNKEEAEPTEEIKEEAKEDEGLPTAEVKPNFENSNNAIPQAKNKKAKK